MVEFKDTNCFSISQLLYVQDLLCKYLNYLLITVASLFFINCCFKLYKVRI